MTSELVAWAMALVGAAGCAALFVRARGDRAQAEAMQAERVRVQEELDRARAQLTHRNESHRKRTEELEELRRKLEKQRKQMDRSREEHRSEPERLRKLEDRLEAAREEVESLRQELAAAHAARQKAERALEVERRERVPAVEPVPAVDPAHAEREARLREKVEQGEAELARARAELDETSAKLARAQKRWETLNKAYLVLRSENELHKDRIREQDREIARLRAIEITLAAPVRVAPEPGGSPEIPETSHS